MPKAFARLLVRNIHMQIWLASLDSRISLKDLADVDQSSRCQNWHFYIHSIRSRSITSQSGLYNIIIVKAFVESIHHLSPMEFHLLNCLWWILWKGSNLTYLKDNAVISKRIGVRLDDSGASIQAGWGYGAQPEFGRKNRLQYEDWYHALNWFKWEIFAMIYLGIFLPVLIHLFFLGTKQLFAKYIHYRLNYESFKTRPMSHISETSNQLQPKKALRCE